MAIPDPESAVPPAEDTTDWTPPRAIRAVAIAVIRRGPRILAMAIREADGQVTGYRPPGGTIEFGERSDQTVIRELREELGIAAEPLRYLGLRENLFTHNGHPGHELVVVWEVRPAGGAGDALDAASLPCIEADLAGAVMEWIDPLAPPARAALFPEGLADLLRGVDAAG